MLGAAANRLHGRPHVTALRQQVPPAREEGISIHTPAVVARLRMTGHAVAQHHRPAEFAVTRHDGVSGTKVTSFVRIEGRVNASVHHIRAGRTRGIAELVAAQGITGMHPNSHDITSLDD